MKPNDPLERAFELLKAECPQAPLPADLENKLVAELHRQNRPKRLKKLVLLGAVLLTLALAGGGLSLTAGFNPIKVFRFKKADGDTWIMEPAKRAP